MSDEGDKIRDNDGDGDRDRDGGSVQQEKKENQKNQKKKQKQKQKIGGLDLIGLFFYAILIPWFVSLFLSLRYGGRADLWPVVVGFFIFQGSNALIHSISPSILPPLRQSSSSSSSSSSSFSLDLFTNTAVSLIHSTIVGISVAGVLASEWIKKGSSMYNHEELFSGVWPGSNVILCVSTGYFVYDQVDMLRRHLYNPSSPSLLVHHAVLLVCFTMALYRQVTINYLILTLFCELHSIFLHLRRVLKMAELQREESWFIITLWAFNWFTFFTSRMAMHIFVTLKLVLDITKFPSGVEWPLAISGMMGLNILNVILGIDLSKAFLKESNSWRKRIHKKVT